MVRVDFTVILPKTILGCAQVIVYMDTRRAENCEVQHFACKG